MLDALGLETALAVALGSPSPARFSLLIQRVTQIVVAGGVCLLVSMIYTPFPSMSEGAGHTSCCYRDIGSDVNNLVATLYIALFTLSDRLQGDNPP